MRNYILLFDSDCPQCTKVARRLQQLKVGDLEVRSRHDPAIVDLFARAGQSVPDEPALVHSSGRNLTVRTGLSMRMRLARMIGARRAADIVGLLSLETKARAARRTETMHPLSRRSLLGGAAATVAGALIFGTAHRAIAQPTEMGTALTPDTRRRVLASPALRRAIGIWGEPDESKIVGAVAPNGENVAVVPHRGDWQAFTIVGSDEGTERDALGITMTANDTRDGIRYYLASGVPLAEQTVQGDKLVTARLSLDAAPPNADPAPEGIREFAACFVVCMVAEGITVECVIACGNCAFGTVFQKAIACPVCAICAGPKGLTCARETCRDTW